MISALSIEHHENTVKMLTAIMAVFALFWLPGQVMAFLLEFETENEFILKYGLDIGYLFVFTNCVMNPFIFAYFSQCHKSFSFLRRPTASSINPTIACELGYSTARRESERRNSIQQRRGSLPGNLKRVPMARTFKRPSLPAILQCEDINEEQKKSLLQAGRNMNFTTSKTIGDVFSRTKQLPVLAEMQNSDPFSSSVQNGDFPCKLHNGDQQLDKQKYVSLAEIRPRLDTVTSMQKGDLPLNIQSSDSTQKRGSIPGSRKKLSFSIQTHDSFSSTQNIQNTPQTEQQMNIEKETQNKHLGKRLSFLAVKTHDSGIQSEKHRDGDAGNRVMISFIEIMKTMKEDVLRKYLEATPETVLN